MSNLTSILGKVGILASIVTIIVILHKYNNKVTDKKTEMFLMGAPVEQIDKSVQKLEGSLSKTSYIKPTLDNANSSKTTYPKECFPKDTLTPNDLLPGNDSANSLFAQLNPLGQGNVSNQNFLNAGYHIGVNTVGQSLRNPNLQLRSEMPNPRHIVSPWMQSTIEPDINRKPLEEISPC
jgi:hypothetical protein